MNQTNPAEAVAAFRKVDFNWAAQLQDVWSDDGWDVPDLHGEIRHEFATTLQSMREGDGRSPLGWIILGGGGVGKTHLVGAMRREAVRQNTGFVLVDMTDVRNFWEVVLQGYLDSLQTPFRDGQFQYQFLLRQFISHVSRPDDIKRNLQRLSQHKTRTLAEDVRKIVVALRRKYPREALEYQDVIRALICLNSEDLEIAATGYSWLQSQEIEDELRSGLGFSRPHNSPREIVRALSWFMSLSGPTVVAFDQLDPIVQQVKYQAGGLEAPETEEEGTARSILEQIGGGFGSMRDTTFNTLSIVTCVEKTMNVLQELVFRTYLDRFEPPRRLKASPHSDVYQMLIEERLAPAYRASTFAAPYETWPFHPDAIRQLRSETVREVLKLCEEHRKRCILADKVTELRRFQAVSEDNHSAGDEHAADRFHHLDTQFDQYRQQTDPNQLLEEKHEDERLAPLYRTALDCLIHEHEQELPDTIDAFVEQDFSGGKTTKPLHARLRIVDHEQGSREDHYCVRALQRRHHAAFKARLKAAMTQSGIDKALKFRHLVIVRSFETPGGKQTATLTQQFQKAGGRFHTPSDEELRTLSALQRLQQDQDPLFMEWLQNRQPVGNLGLGEILTRGSRFETVAARTPDISLLRPSPTLETATADDDTPVPSEVDTTEASHRPESPVRYEREQQEAQPGSVNTPAAPARATQTVNAAEPPAKPQVLPFGRRFMPLGKLGDVVSLPLTALTKHTVILGGSGSGKSVTLRRVVEEAALAGIPSIVVDCAQDMCLFDQAWPETPGAWGDGDAQQADAFHRRVDQVVWTPGSLSSGNPLSLRPLPDFTPLKDDPEELEDAVTMACDGLKDIVAAGTSQRARNSHGVLKHSLHYFARHFPDQGLNGYIQFLFDLPAEAKLGISNEQRLAETIASSLKVEQTTNPLLKDAGSPLDPLVLFGDDQPRETVRISVISLVKLKGQNAARSFLNQLAMELFSWIKQNPTPPNNRPLRGLLVIDEARDFVPSQKSSECKESMMRLAAQARKYRLGLVFATQHPKDIETRIVGNCATHLYGLNNSPASLATLQDLMAQKGGSGHDIPQLKAGQFYIYNSDAGHAAPLKIQVPMSLSYSPDNPLQENEILQKAAESARRIG